MELKEKACLTCEYCLCQRTIRLKNPETDEKEITIDNPTCLCVSPKRGRQEKVPYDFSCFYYKRWKTIETEIKKQAKRKKRDEAIADYEKQEEAHFVQEEEANVHTHTEADNAYLNIDPTNPTENTSSSIETSDPEYYKHVGTGKENSHPKKKKSKGARALSLILFILTLILFIGLFVFPFIPNIDESSYQAIHTGMIIFFAVYLVFVAIIVLISLIRALSKASKNMHDDFSNNNHSFHEDEHHEDNTNSR